MQDLYGKGYHLYVDNGYTSEELFDHLEQNGTAACGTARLNRLKVSASLKKGDHAFRRNVNLLMVRYKDKKEMYLLDTIHEVKIERVPKRGREDLFRSKLSLANDYNKYMGGDCVKSVQIRSFFWSVYSLIRAEYGEILYISPYSVQMRVNRDQKKLSIWTLYTHWVLITMML